MSSEHLDSEALAELEDIMEDEFDTLLKTYLNDADQKLVQMSGALSAGDSRALREIAHSFKGASCNVGALPLSRLCEDVEQRAHQEQLEGVDSLMAGIEAEYAEVRSLLSQRL